MLRLRRAQPVTITCYQLEKTAPLYVFLYLDRPEQLVNALESAPAAGGKDG